MTDINRFLQNWYRFFWGQQFDDFEIWDCEIYNLLLQPSFFFFFFLILIISPISKIFLNIKFLIIFFGPGNFFPTLNFSYYFADFKMYAPKISPALNFFYYLSDFENFLQNKTFHYEFMY